jgi:hypothetical protein|eukprot:COSAG01_NODE_779_length_13670_cov_10.504974_2_plen_67_part_00
MDRDISDAKAAECKALVVPPVNPATGEKYHTVTGNTAGSQVWIVYENGRACESADAATSPERANLL